MASGPTSTNDTGARCSTQLIDGDGTLNVTGIEQFIDMTKFNQCGLSYNVVSIMGPQSSGKSTLLNQMFGTKFVEMDAEKRRSQTTRGVWLAKDVGTDLFTMVMDLEGNDGRERGECGKAFERQIALFALAVSDTVLINMWCHDIGREDGANKPLLRILFEVYVTKLSCQGKTTLMFVIRDKTETPLDSLKCTVIQDIQEIWDSVSKPAKHQNTSLSEVFNIEVVGLSHREYRKDDFRKDVASLKQRLFLANTHDARNAVPASEFSSSCQQFWKTIRENKDLDIPAHKILMAIKRCNEIADNVYTSFEESKEWHEMNDWIKSGRDFSGFRQKLCAIIGTATERYRKEAMDFDEGTRSKREIKLAEDLLTLGHPTLCEVLSRIERKAFKGFREAFHKAVSGGESNLVLAAESYKRTFMTQFDTQSEGAGVRLSDSDLKPARIELEEDIDEHIEAYFRDRPAPEAVGYPLVPAVVEQFPKPKRSKKSLFGRIAIRVLCLALVPLIGVDLGPVFDVATTASDIYTS